MHPFFSVTLFTGQQLVLEALQRWLARPCPDAVSQARRRLGVKQLISLLLRTAATGVLATVLDAAIEFRRRQLLAAAAVEPSDESGAGSAAPTSLFPGLGMLSRAGVAAWKSRLLLAIDELERRAGDFGIESRHRFSPAKAVAEPAELVSAGKPLRHPAAGSCIDLAGTGAEPECSQHLGRTVEQLRELVQQKDPESQRRLDAEVGSLVDLILGACPSAPATPSGTRPGAAGSAACSAAAAAAGRCRSVPSALDGLWAEGTGAAEDLCAICMDRPVTVQVAGCSHDLCFSCARRLCASHDHLVPQCPFCRQAIEGFVARPLPSLGRPAAAPAVRA